MPLPVDVNTPEALLLLVVQEINTIRTDLLPDLKGDVGEVKAMLSRQNGRLRDLEIEAMTPAKCDLRHKVVTESNKGIILDFKSLAGVGVLIGGVVVGILYALVRMGALPI